MPLLSARDVRLPFEHETETTLSQSKTNRQILRNITFLALAKNDVHLRYSVQCLDHNVWLRFHWELFPSLSLNVPNKHSLFYFPYKNCPDRTLYPIFANLWLIRKGDNEIMPRRFLNKYLSLYKDRLNRKLKQHEQHNNEIKVHYNKTGNEVPLKTIFRTFNDD